MKLVILVLALLIVVSSACWAQTSVTGGGGSGSGLPVLPTSPNSVPQTLTSTPSGGVGGAAAWNLSGVTPNTQTGTSYTVLATDRAGYVTLNNSGAVAVTLPQAGSAGFISKFVFTAKNLGVGAVTITPTTSTINGNATLVLNQGDSCTIYSDDSNYFSRCGSEALIAGGGISLTRTATGVTVSSSITGGSGPGWLKYYGDGSDGAGPASGAINSRTRYYTTWTCTGAITSGALGTPIAVFATGAVSLNTGCSISNNGNTALTQGSNNDGNIGSGGGGGGGGTGAGTAGSGATVLSTSGGSATTSTLAAGGTAGAASGGAGGAGAAITLTNQHAVIVTLPFAVPFLNGGGAGQVGGSGGGARVAGGGVIVIAAPSITIASGVYFDVSGASGNPSTANSTGPSGGGGGGTVILATPILTDNGAVFNVQGQGGGSCVNPAVVLTVPSGLTGMTTAGTGGIAHVSTFSGGNPTAITVDAAGSGYNFIPACAITGTGGGGNTGSGATCTVTMSDTAANCKLNANCTISSIAVSGGNAGYGTGTTFTTCGTGGYGGNGWAKEIVVQ